MRLAAKQPETAKVRSDDARGLRTDTRDASERARGAECDLAASSYPTRLGGNADSAVRVPILIEIRVMRDGTPSRRCAALVLAMLAPVEFARVATGARASGSRSARIEPRDSPRPPRAPRPLRASGRSSSPKRKSRSFIILPADGFEGREGDGGWSLWQASEAGSVLVGTRRARRKRQQMSDHWRKIMAMGGVEGAEPEDVARRIAVALEAVESEHERYAAELHELERGNRGADVCATEVKRLKVRKLRAKDDAARLRRAAAAAADLGGASAPGCRARARGSFA